MHLTISKAAFAGILTLCALLLAGCSPSPYGIYLSEQQARASQVPTLIRVTHEGVANTYAYLRKHPRIDDMLYWRVDPVPDFLDGNVEYVENHSAWNDWYILTTYGDGLRDGAYAPLAPATP